MNPLITDFPSAAARMPVIVALDFADEKSTLAFVRRLEPDTCQLKIGKELFTASGRHLAESLINQGFKLFLDLKYHDIPHTVAQACKVAADMGVWMVDMHASGCRRPQMASHSAALQQAVDEHVKPGMTVRLFGNFKMSKLVGYRPDIYGRDTQPVPGQPLLTRHGAQPCLMLRADNNIYDLSNCVFTVDKLFQDGVHIAGYQGDCRAEHMGHWFTAAILAVDPGKLSASNWKGALGSKGRGNDWLAPIDNNTGFAFNGNTTCGFNTSAYAYDLAPFRNNSLDTSRLSAGGYGRAFPQVNGRTAATWGTWRGGWIGNAGSALVIYHLPSVPESARTIAHFTCAGIYGRGFAGAVIEVGLLGKPDSTHLSRWGAGIEPYVPRNIRLHNTLAEDTYTAGIQHNRYIDVWEQGSHIRRSGHPDWSLEHTNPARPGAS